MGIEVLDPESTHSLYSCAPNTITIWVSTCHKKVHENHTKIHVLCILQHQLSKIQYVWKKDQKEKVQNVQSESNLRMLFSFYFPIFCQNFMTWIGNWFLKSRKNPPIMNKWGIMEERGLLCENFLCASSVEYLICMNPCCSHYIHLKKQIFFFCFQDNKTRGHTSIKRWS